MFGLRNNPTYNPSFLVIFLLFTYIVQQYTFINDIIDVMYFLEIVCRNKRIFTIIKKIKKITNTCIIIKAL